MINKSVNRRAVLIGTTAVALAGCTSPGGGGSEGSYPAIISVDDLGAQSDAILMGEFTSFTEIPYSPAPEVTTRLVLGTFAVSRSSSDVMGDVLVSWGKEYVETTRGLDDIKKGAPYVLFAVISRAADRDDLQQYGDLYTPTGLTMGMFTVSGGQATMIGDDFHSVVGASATPSAARRARTQSVDDLFRVTLRQR